MDPAPFTLAALLAMAESHAREQWDHTAALMALAVNICGGGKHGESVTPQEFNPYRKNEKKPIPTVPLTVLRDLWVKKA